MNGWARWKSWLVPVALAVLAALLVASQVRNSAALVRVWIPWAEVGCLAMTMTCIVVAGGIDLSVGSMVALSAVVLAAAWEHGGWSIGWASLAAVTTGLLAGVINGQLVVAGLSPLVATLATMAFYRGLAMALSAAKPVSNFPPEFLAWSRWAGIPVQFWLLGLITLAAYAVLHHRPAGRALFALGDNPAAARWSGVRVASLQRGLYWCSGLVAGLIAVAHTMQHNSVVGDAFQGLELQAIACVVVGGTLITGGGGSVFRTVLGLLATAHLEIGLSLLSFQYRWLTAESRLIALGLLLIGITIWNQRQQHAIQARRT